ncbi:hypothetical protein CTAYLR_000055 [Chrysophaeum taylorii]|uniref:Sulfotransferase domain-containing protein n=1 Tax=Chrysophaeum taylorii TaxID=2483200 RepID=A0AAD7XK66_9STRA|nr:hypothetical protein CTAYLR_000055 [Chrysophaeum taylorii]
MLLSLLVFALFAQPSSAGSGCRSLRALASGEELIAVAFSTASYAPLALNWAVSAQRLGLPYALLSLDAELEAILGDAGANVVPVQSLSHDAWREWKDAQQGPAADKLAALWNARAVALETILVGCNLQGKQVLHSDVDVVFVRDPRPKILEASCDHCFGAGEFPQELATKWQTPTACAGFAAHRATTAFGANLAKRVRELTRIVGDDQVATNRALDELGWDANGVVRGSGGSARFVFSNNASFRDGDAAVTILDSLLFPVGGCDRWLDVLASLEGGEPGPIVLHPNCVDKAGTSKESWLRRRDGWLLAADWQERLRISGRRIKDLLNETAARRLSERFQQFDDDAAVACEARATAVDVASRLDVSVIPSPPSLALVFDKWGALLEVANALNSRGLVGSFFVSHDTPPPVNRILACKRLDEGHDVSCAYHRRNETSRKECGRRLFGGRCRDPPAFFLSRNDWAIREFENDEILDRCVVITDDAAGTALLEERVARNETACLKFVTSTKTKTLETQLEKLDGFSTKTVDEIGRSMLATRLARIENARVCEGGRIASARVLVDRLTDDKLSTDLWIRLRLPAKIRRANIITTIVGTDGALEFFEKWLESVARIFNDADVPLRCLKKQKSQTYRRFEHCDESVESDADLAIQPATNGDSIARAAVELRSEGMLLCASFGATVRRVRSHAATAGLAVIEVQTGPALYFQEQQRNASMETYAVVVLWAKKVNQHPPLQQHKEEEDTAKSLRAEAVERHEAGDDISALELFNAAYDFATEDFDSRERAESLFGLGALLHASAPARAAEYYERSLDLEANFSRALGNLAAIRYDEDRISDAIDLLERAVAVGYAPAVSDLFQAQQRASRGKKLGLLDRTLALLGRDRRPVRVVVVCPGRRFSDDDEVRGTEEEEEERLLVFTEWSEYLAAIQTRDTQEDHLLVFAPGWSDAGDIARFLRRELARRRVRVVSSDACDAHSLLTRGDEAYVRGDNAAATAAYRAVIDGCGLRNASVNRRTVEEHLVTSLSTCKRVLGEAETAAAYYKLGVLAHERLELYAAEDLYVRALECDSRLADAWNNVGVVCLRTDRLETGASCFARGSADGENRRFAEDLLSAQRHLLLSRAPRTDDEGVHLISGLYRQASSAARYGELVTAQRTNLAIDVITSLHSFGEDVDPREALLGSETRGNADKLVAVPFGARQPDYADFLEYANRYLTGKVVVVAHADIYFDDTVGCVQLLRGDESRIAFAMTRRPAPSCVRASGGGHVLGLPANLCASSENIHGYDAFAFVSPVPQSIVSAARGVKQNVLGSDLRLIDAFVEAGYTMLNPCAQIAAFHLHLLLEEHTVVLVASFPRSGSTMLRKLVERASGTRTGSTHLDPELLMNERFLGEGYCSGSFVSVVKTHHPAIIDFGPRDCQQLLANAADGSAPAVLLVRDPFDAIRSYWEYSNENEVHSSSSSSSSSSWSEFAVVEARRWRLLVDHWRSAVNLTVRYEDLVAAPVEALESVLQIVFRGSEKNVDVAIRRWRDAGVSPKRRRHGTREDASIYDADLASAVFEAAGGREVLCPLGYAPPKSVQEPCGGSTMMTPPPDAFERALARYEVRRRSSVDGAPAATVVRLTRVPKTGSSWLSLVARSLVGCKPEGQPCCVYPGDPPGSCPRRGLECPAVLGCAGHQPREKRGDDFIPSLVGVRSPRARLASAFFYAPPHRPPGTCATLACFASYVELPEYRNVMTRMLARNAYPYDPMIDASGDAALAKARLCGSTVVHVAEAPASTAMLAYETPPFDRVRPSRAVFWSNLTGLRRNLKSDYAEFVASRDDGVDAAIRTNNAADLEVYSFALRLFCARLEAAGLLEERVVFEELRGAGIACGGSDPCGGWLSSRPRLSLKVDSDC